MNIKVRKRNMKTEQQQNYEKISVNSGPAQ